LAGGRQEEQLFLNLRREMIQLQDLAEPRAASMRRPLLSTENCLSPKKKGIHKGGLPLLWGSRRFFPAWGEPTQPSVPWGIGKGELRSCSYKFVRPPPIRPASIRTLT
jgi:hypothetical protein